MTDNPNFLDDKDVVYFNVNSHDSEAFDINPTMTVEEIKQKIQKWTNAFFRNNKKNFQIIPNFFRPCEVLKQDGKGWKTGKIRLRIEFIPDETEASEETDKSNYGTLDDFRN
jgi:hypothetical protein